MSKRKRPLIQGSQQGLDQLKVNVMNKNGYQVAKNHPEQAKMEVAKEQGIPLNKSYNGELTSRQAGKVGGPIGGKMVSELIKMAKKQME
ncbi:alpha/beta-type small acid-soluble spore protein [Bacillus sp. AK128]